MTDRYVIVLTTISLDVDPSVLGTRLVEERLAACVNVLPEMDSFFRWRGAVERDQERQVIMKTTAARLPDLERRLHELHPYELPEFLVVECSREATPTCDGSGLHEPGRPSPSPRRELLPGVSR